MTTATNATIVDMTTDTGFRNWVQEVITMLFTTLGVTQTADTGQINTSTVTRPSTANASAGYVIGRFNDTAQGTSPVFFKLEFGTGNTATTSVQMWITIGTGSNGSGTLSGIVGARASCGGGTPYNNVTSYATRACYNATAGVLWMAWKTGLYNTTNQAGAGFAIYRSADSTGTVTTDAVMLITNSYTVTLGTQYGYIQALSFLNSTAYYFNSGGWSSNQVGSWATWPFYPNTTLYNNNCQFGLVFQFTPVIGITPWLALCLVGELAVGSTVSTAIVGTTNHTYISAGSVFGNLNNFTSQGSYQCAGGSGTSTSLVLLWE